MGGEGDYVRVFEDEIFSQISLKETNDSFGHGVGDGANMARCGATAAADDAGAGVDGHRRVLRHQQRVPGVDDFGAVELGDPAVALGDHDRAVVVEPRQVDAIIVIGELRGRGSSLERLQLLDFPFDCPGSRPQPRLHHPARPP